MKRAGRLRQRHGLIVKGKRISCPPHYAPPNNDYDPPHHDYEHGFPLIRSLRASAQRSTSVLFSFVLSLLDHGRINLSSGNQRTNRQSNGYRELISLDLEFLFRQALQDRPASRPSSSGNGLSP